MNLSPLSRLSAVAVCLLLLPCFMPLADADVDDVHTLYGSTAPPPGVHVVEVLDDFGTESADDWTMEMEASRVPVEFGWSPAQFTGHVMRLQLEGEGVWGFNRSLVPDAAWAEADGIRVVLAWKETVRAWISMDLTANGEKYSNVFTPYDYVERELSDRTVWFEDIGEGQFDPMTVENLKIFGSKQANTLYMVEIQLVKRAVRDGWLRLRTNHPDTNMFEAGSDVTLTFQPEGVIPEGADGFHYEIEDYFRNVVASGTIGFGGGVPTENDYQAVFDPPGSGYYEVSAWWTGSTDVEESVIKEAGSMPFGISTFAVMPRTVAENHADMTQGSFFGLHGHTHNLAEMLGAAWGIKGIRWNNYEKDARPERPGGATAVWAQDAIAAGPEPAWKHTIWDLSPHLKRIPDWATGDENDFYHVSDWTDIELFVRDAVRVHKACYPHMNPRVYDLMWEPDLQIGSGSVNAPRITAAELAEFYQRLAPIVRQEDPDAVVIGPCFSSTVDAKLAQMEDVFDANLLDVLDGLSLHPYHSIPPEQSNLLPYLSGVRQLAAARTERELPVYATEWGFQSYLGSQSKRREAAAWTMRSNIMLKGEGVQASLLFYSYDYGPPWGICYNLAPTYPEQPWGPDRVAPKPAVSALAAQIEVLNHTQSLGPIDSLPEGAYGYAFKREGEKVAVVWTVQGSVDVELTTPGEQMVTVADIMGSRTTRTASGGTVNLTATPELQYIVMNTGQTIDFPALSAKTYGDASFAAGATASSGLAVSYSSSDASVATVSGGTIAITGAGTVDITAHQDGDTNWDAAADVTRTLTVAKATPVLTWADPAPVAYGTALDGTQLNATADVPGAFAYDPATGTVLDAGTHTLSTTFTPDDAANYETVPATAQLEVTRANQTIDFPALSAKTYGDASFAAGATASSGLAVSYSSSDASVATVSGGTIAITGAGTVDITAHQDGDTNWDAAADVTRTLTVAKATPVLTWADPAPVAYGTALDGTQLNATADVPGAFAYDPATGTVLDAGTHTLSTTFTPDDAANYETVPATAQLEVVREDPFGGIAGYPNVPMTLEADVRIWQSTAGPGDVVGALVGNELRGFAPVVVRNGGIAVADVTIDVAAAGEVAAFKLWDSSAAAVLECPQTLELASGGSAGTWPDDLFVLDFGVAEQSFNLAGGWNHLSFYLDHADPAPGTVFGSVIDNLERVVGSNKNFAPHLEDGMNTLTGLEAGRGYWVKMAGPATLHVDGPPLSAEATPISLQAGWNDVGYVLDRPHRISETLAGISGKLERVIASGGNYDPTLPDFLQTLQSLRPGRGYWIKVSEAAELRYTRDSMRELEFPSGSRPTLELPDYWELATYPQVQARLIGTIQLNGHPAADGMAVGAFVGGECRGFEIITASHVRTDVTWCNLTIEVEQSGDTARFLLYAPDTGLTYASEAQVTLAPGDTVGSEEQPFALDFALIEAPILTVQPVDLVSERGASAVFDVEAAGSLPRAYAWYHDGALIEGADEPVLRIGVVDADDAGEYVCTVSNRAGDVTSRAASLTVVDPLRLTSASPGSGTDGGDGTLEITNTVTVREGEPRDFSVTATGGSGEHAYVWKLDGQPVGGDRPTFAYSPAFDVVQHPARARSQILTCTLYDSLRRTTARAVWSNVRVEDANLPPSLQSAVLEANTDFSVLTARGEGWNDPDGDPETYLYDWTRNGQPVPGDHGAELDGGILLPGDRVSCVLTPVDDQDSGGAVETQTVRIPGEGEWDVVLSADGLSTCAFGMRAGALPGTDPEDVPLELPSADRGAVYFWQQEKVYERDMRSLESMTHWLLVAQAAGPQDLMIGWRVNSDFPSARYLSLQEVDAGGKPVAGGRFVDMAAASQLTVEAGTTSFFAITFADELRVELALYPGWNLISIPVDPVDADIGRVFSGPKRGTVHSGAVWGWRDGRYAQARQISTGHGYWVYAPAEATVVVAGYPPPAARADLNAGWNLLGVASPLTLTGRDKSVAWWWDAQTSSYRKADTLMPGLGYWLYGGSPLNPSVPGETK